MIRTHIMVFAFLIPLVAASAARADSINERAVAFLKSKLGTRVGGGECAHAVSEALRVSSAAFAESELGSDNPEPGDYVWGTLIKVVSNTDGEVIDSEPSAKVLPGDVLQYHGSRFVSVTQIGNTTRTKTETAEHHTAMAARVDADSRYPIEVYEQNAPSRDKDNARQVILNSIDFPSLRAGWVRIYRPKARVDKPGRYQVSIVNNTSEDQSATVRFDDSPVSKISLTSADTATSYTLPTMETSSTTNRFSIALDDGAMAPIQNAAGYEIFMKPDGKVAIRKLPK